jgi:membrane carboxypeptidase/penicillin-binding protein
LTLAECAMLAPIVQYPAMNPIDNPDQAKKRQQIALDRMVEEGYISRTEAEAAFSENLQVRTSLLKRYDLVAPHFAMYVRKQLEDLYGLNLLYSGGLKVYTTVDLEINRIAEEEARAHVARLQEQKVRRLERIGRRHARPHGRDPGHGRQHRLLERVD